jgi:hypothetical protein
MRLCKYRQKVAQASFSKFINHFITINVPSKIIVKNESNRPIGDKSPNLGQPVSTSYRLRMLQVVIILDEIIDSG